MVFFDYFEELLGGVEYLIALGSLVGLLGVFIGALLFLGGGKRVRYHMLGIIIVSFMLLSVCGFDTGIKYFRLFR